MARIYRPPEETKALIIKHADEAIRHYGYHKTTISDIAKACNMSPANIYRFFESKEDIASALIDNWREKLQESLLNIYNKGQAPEETLRACIWELFEQTNRLYVKENKVHELAVIAIDEVWDSFALYLYMVRGLFMQILEDGVKNGDFQLRDETKRVAHSLMYAIVVYMHPHVLAQFSHQSLDKRLNTLLDILIHGLRA